jgi:hypothetical protein
MTVFFIAIVLVPACAFYLYALKQFWREAAQLRSDRARHAVLATSKSSGVGPLRQVESPEMGPMAVIPIRGPGRIAEAVTRRRAG